MDEKKFCLIKCFRKLSVQIEKSGEGSSIDWSDFKEVKRTKV